MKITQFLLILALSVVSLGSDCGSAPDSVGFDITTTETHFNPNGRPAWYAVFGVEVSARHVQDRSDLGVVKGNLTATDYVSHGRDWYFDGRAAANWHFTIHNGGCAGQSITFAVKQKDNQRLDCDFTVGGVHAPFYATPSDINMEAPPLIVTITGGGIDPTYGMPVVDFYDDYGTLVARTSAFDVSADGTVMRVVTPDLWSAQGGSYLVMVSNVVADGTYYLIGDFSMALYTPAPPEPPGGDPDSDPCYPYCLIY